MIGRQFFDCRFQHIGARVAYPVDAMAKSHQPVAARQRRVDPGLDAFATADGVQHFQHRFRRAAMQRPGQRAIGGGHGGKQIGLGGGHHPRREGGGVHPVIRNRDEIGVQRRRLTRGNCAPVQHPQTVHRMAQRGVRLHRRFALCLTRQCTHDHRHGAHDCGFWRKAGLGLQSGDPGAKAIHQRKSLCCRQDLGQACECPFPRLAKLGAHFGLGDRRFTGRRPQPGGHPLEAACFCQVGHGFPGNDQNAVFAIHMAQRGLRGHHAIKPASAPMTRHTMNCHVRSPLLQCTKDRVARRIDQS